MPKVIYVAGHKRSGKDTFGALLKEELEVYGKTVKLISFAGPMKQILSVTLGTNLATLDAKKNDPSYPHRGYLQRLGTEAMKPIFGDDVWVKLANIAITEATEDYCIITDFRFPEEFEGCVVTPLAIKVERTSAVPLAGSFVHVSEYALAHFGFDEIIENNGTLKCLKKKAKNFISQRINI